MKELIQDLWIIIKEFATNIFPQLSKAIPGPLGELLALLGDIKKAWILFPAIISFLYWIYGKINYTNVKDYKRK